MLIGRFHCACVTVTCRFDPEEMLKSIMLQFDPSSGNMDGIDSSGSKLARLLDETKYMIILDDLLSIVEWDALSV